MAQQTHQTSRRPTESAERSLSGFVASTLEEESQRALELERGKNTRWSRGPAATAGVVCGLVVVLASFWLNLLGGLALGLLTGLFVGFFVARFAPTAVVSNLGAAPLEPEALPRVELLLNGLSATMGVATPSIAVLDDPIANACIYLHRKQSTVVITSGLLSALSLVELEGVLAHLLAHLRLESVRRGTAGAGYALMLGAMGRRGGLAHRLIGRGRLYRADQVAVRTVRYPQGLAGALAKMEQGPRPAPGSYFASSSYQSLRWLFVDPSIGRRARADELGDLDATATRRQVLEEL
jgi:Zn-dependent protease with chaperone function